MSSRVGSVFTVSPGGGSGGGGYPGGYGDGGGIITSSVGDPEVRFGAGGSGQTPVIDPSFSCPTSTRVVTTTRFAHTTVTNVIHSVAESIRTKYVTATVLRPTPKTITHTVTRVQNGNVQSAQRVVITTGYTVRRPVEWLGGPGLLVRLSGIVNFIFH